jgi:membrane-associated phospholipid phosphatase
MEQAHPIRNRHPDGQDDGGWLLLGLTLLLMLPLELFDPFGWSIHSLIKPCGFALLLGVIGHFYTRHRPDPKISAMVTGLQVMMLFSAAGASLSYMVAARGGAMWDRQLTLWDHAVGLDWLGWMHWVNAHPLFALTINLAYRTLIPQMIALILILGLCGRLAALRIVMQAAMIAGLAIILLSGLLPSAGTYSYYALNAADFPNLHPAAAFLHMADLTGLRDGTLRLLTLDRMEGIITFPSYHGALAVIFCWGFSRASIAPVRWAGITIALLTLIATPVDGGHYFSDVIAGALIAAISLAVAHRTIHMTVRLRPARAASAVLAPAT